jgi:DNA (cytosine-5)-methyltransferase 1
LITTLDLFAGIGGFALGLEATGHFRTTCFVENEPYCQAVLKHHWPDIPVLGDIRNVRREELPDPSPGLICGGFPCQPFSNAGKQRAQDDPRHLWPEMFRLIRECRPTWVVGENVTGLINLGLDEVLSDLEGEGYATRTFNIPACAVGAPHLRQRLWIVAHSDSESEPDKSLDGSERDGQLGFGFMANPNSNDGGGESGSKPPNGGTRLEHSGSGTQRDVADTGSEGCEPSRTTRKVGETQTEESRARDKSDVLPSASNLTMANTKRPGTRMEEHRGSGQRRESPNPPQPEVLRQEDGAGGTEGIATNSGRPEEWWEVEPSVGRLVDGLPNRVPQLRALGNAIVPQIAKEIGEAIHAAEIEEPKTHGDPQA